MINKTFICSYNKNGQCTHPSATNPALGPDVSAPFNNNMTGGCRQLRCSGYLAPFSAKTLFPVSTISTAHTPLTIASLGPNIVYYVFDPNKKILSFQESDRQFPASGVLAVKNLVSEWYDNNGYPPFLSIDRLTNQKWGCSISGWFMAQANGVHTFYVAGDGFARVNFNGSDLGGGLFGVKSNAVAVSKATTSLVSGQWYPLKIDYGQIDSSLGGYSVLVGYPGAPFNLPLSAGMFVGGGYTLVNGTLPFSYFTVPDIIDWELSEDDNASTTLTFSVAAAPSGAAKGFYFNPQQSIYKPNSSGSVNAYLRKDELIKLDVGYQTNGFNDTITKFVGHITDVDVSVTADGQTAYKVTCQDFMRFLNEKQSWNYPTLETYWLADMSNDQNSIGFKRGTPAFDAWPVVNVYRALMTHAGIDPTLFKEKFEWLQFSGATTIGTEYLISPVSGANKFPSASLERSIAYGNPNSALVGGRPDSQYNFKYGFGEKLSDVLIEISENFGYKFGFRGYNNGAPYLMAMNTPNNFYPASGWVYSGTWSLGVSGNQGTTYNINALGGQYAFTYFSGSKASVIVTGNAIQLIAPCYPHTGINGPHLNVVVKSVDTNQQIISTNLNLYSPLTWQFYDGINSRVGYNPTVFNIASGLPYRAYRVFVESLSSGTPVGWNAVLSYEKDTMTPAFTSSVLRSGSAPNVYAGNIFSYGLGDSTDEMRNDIVIVGRSKGLETHSTPYDLPQYYYVGRAIDVNSIFIPSSVNYIGRPRTGMITNDRITSDERANYIAYTALNRLRVPGKKMDLTVVGNPLIEVYDGFRVVDNYFNLVDDARYIFGLRQQMSIDGFETTIDSQDFPFYGSFITKPEITASGIKMIENVSVKNRGQLFSFVGNISAGAATVSLSGIDTDAIPITASRNPDPETLNSYCNCYYLGASKTYDYPFVISGVTTTDLKVWDLKFTMTAGEAHEILVPYDPYTSEEGKYVDVFFDLTKKSRVRVDIIDAFNGTLVATLTGNDKAEHEDEKYWTILDIGQHKFSWAGIDQFGEYNKLTPMQKIGLAFDLNAAMSKPHQQRQGILDWPDVFINPQYGRPAAGMYVSEMTFVKQPNHTLDALVLLYGKFYVRITAKHLVTGEVYVTKVDTQPIYTKRGSPVYERMNVYYEGDYLKYWADDPAKLLIDDNKIPGQPFFTSKDNSSRGLKINMECPYSPGPITYEHGSMFITPKQFTYSVKPTYWRLTGMRAQRITNDDDGNKNYYRMIFWGSIDSNLPEIEGEMITLVDRTKLGDAMLQAGDYNHGNVQGKYYHTTYFDPAYDHQLDFRQHAGELSKDWLPSISPRVEVWAWCIELNVTMQDISGRSYSLINYFNWVGKEADGSFIGQSTYDSYKNTYFVESIGPAVPNESIPTTIYRLTTAFLSAPDHVKQGTAVAFVDENGGYWQAPAYGYRHEAGKVNCQVGYQA